MTLIKFLVHHCQKMQRCFVIEHFEVSFLRIKKCAGVMDINIDYEYLDAVIRYDGDVEVLWKTGQKEAILKVLCHELTHILTGMATDGITLTRQQTKQDEQANEHISRLLYRLYRRRK